MNDSALLNHIYWSILAFVRRTCGYTRFHESSGTCGAILTPIVGWGNWAATAQSPERTIEWRSETGEPLRTDLSSQVTPNSPNVQLGDIQRPGSRSGQISRHSFILLYRWFAAFWFIDLWVTIWFAFTPTNNNLWWILGLFGLPS